MSIVATRTEEMERDNRAAISTFRALTNMVLSLPRAVGIKAHSDANEAVAMLKSRLPGTDVEAGDEPWGPGIDAMPSREKIGIGRPQEMSGGGTSRFTEDFSPDAHTGDRNDRQGAALAAMLERQDRLEESVEKSHRVLEKITQFLSANIEKAKKADAQLAEHSKGIRAISVLLAQALGKADAASVYGVGDEDEEDRKRDEEENTTNKAIAQFDVPGLMKHLATGSRSSSTLSAPPNLAVVKAHKSDIDALSDAAANAETAQESIAAAEARMRLQMRAIYGDEYINSCGGAASVDPRYRNPHGMMNFNVRS